MKENCSLLVRVLTVSPKANYKLATGNYKLNTYNYINVSWILFIIIGENLVRPIATLTKVTFRHFKLANDKSVSNASNKKQKLKIN